MKHLSAMLLSLLSTALTMLLYGSAPTPVSSTQHTYTCRTLVREYTVAAQTLRYPSEDLPQGEERLLCEGCDGAVRVTYAVTMEDGNCVSQDVVSRKVLRQKTDRVVLYGLSHALTPSNDAENTFLSPSGERITYTKKLSVLATAYSCEGYTGITAIGTKARVGAIAVDPSIIPYGTRMYIVSDDGAYIYGYATAEDCGGFSGYQIDLYLDTVDACWQFGCRHCTVYILD